MCSRRCKDGAPQDAILGPGASQIERCEWLLLKRASLASHETRAVSRSSCAETWVRFPFPWWDMRRDVLVPLSDNVGETHARLSS